MNVFTVQPLPFYARDAQQRDTRQRERPAQQRGTRWRLARLVAHLLEVYIQLHRFRRVGGTVLALEDMFVVQL